MNAPDATLTFGSLNLPAPLLKALDDTGYETPTPIQAEAIPPLLEGRDLVGHAPTGTGKTAAFALPLLARLDFKERDVQALVLTPTRELAIQVAEAFQRYAAHMKDFHVLPIYGGQGYDTQLRQLRRGVQVVVGTPGRVMDHMRRGTLNLGSLKTLVLDEADEMLRMGFIDDVEWVLEQSPAERQLVLFSATMPVEIERIARAHLRNPHDISIKAKTATAETIRQRYWQVSGMHKLDALTRILEVEPFEAMLIFVRTKHSTLELAEKLEARGFGAAALNGDMAQSHREQMINRLKNGMLDILIATDVAARGLDVDRISHVINYDIPTDTESYIHRIGRTGRAGRQGDAILFVSNREQRLLAAIERATRQRITPLDLPTAADVSNRRIAVFKQRITDAMQSTERAFMQSIIEQYQQEHDVTGTDVAAALGCMVLGNRPLTLAPDEGRVRRKSEHADRPERPDFSAERFKDNRSGGERAGRDRFDDDRFGGEKPPRRKQRIGDHEVETWRIEVGSDHGVAPGNLVGAIANEAGLDSSHIGRIEIFPEYSTVDLPIGMPKAIFQDLRKAWVCGRQLLLSRATRDGTPHFNPPKHGDASPQHPAKRISRAPIETRPEKHKKSHRKGGGDTGYKDKSYRDKGDKTGAGKRAVDKGAGEKHGAPAENPLAEVGRVVLTRPVRKRAKTV